MNVAFTDPSEARPSKTLDSILDWGLDWKKVFFLVFMLVSSVVWNFRTSCYHLIRFIVIKYAQTHRN